MINFISHHPYLFSTIAIPVPSFMPPLKLKPVISARRYDNRITVVQADLGDIDLSPWLEDKNM